MFHRTFQFRGCLHSPSIRFHCLPFSLGLWIEICQQGPVPSSFSKGQKSRHCFCFFETRAFNPQLKKLRLLLSISKLPTYLFRLGLFFYSIASWQFRYFFVRSQPCPCTPVLTVAGSLAQKGVCPFTKANTVPGVVEGEELLVCHSVCFLDNLGLRGTSRALLLVVRRRREPQTVQRLG